MAGKFKLHFWVSEWEDDIKLILEKYNLKTKNEIKVSQGEVK